MDTDDSYFTTKLISGEHLLWSGRPGQGIVFSSRDVFLVPFSLVWCGFAIFWTITATNGRAPGFFTLWGLMFVAVGLYLVIGRFFVDAWLRRNTRYAVTDRRIFIARLGMNNRFTALGLGLLPGLDISERPDGRGTIRFGQPASASWNNNRNGSWNPASDPTPQFIAIENAQSVFDIIQRHIPD